MLNYVNTNINTKKQVRNFESEASTCVIQKYIYGNLITYKVYLMTVVDKQHIHKHDCHVTLTFRFYPKRLPTIICLPNPRAQYKIKPDVAATRTTYSCY